MKPKKRRARRNKRSEAPARNAKPPQVIVRPVDTYQSEVTYHRARPRSFAIALVLALAVPLFACVRLAFEPLFTYYPDHAPEYALRPDGKQRLAVDGPYYQIQPGSYVASFRVRADARVAGPIARIEVVGYDKRGVITASRELSYPAATRSNTTTGYQDESLPFRVSFATSIGTRVFYYGIVPMVLQGTRIWPAAPSLPVRKLGLWAFLAWLGLVVLLTVGWLSRSHPSLRVFLYATGKLYLLSLMGVVVGTAERATPIQLPGATLTTPYSLLLLVLMLGGSVPIMLSSMDTRAFRTVGLAADLLSDAVVISLFVSTVARLNFFLAAVIALAIWSSKVFIATATLACKRKATVSQAAVLGLYVYSGLIVIYSQYPPTGDQPSYLTEAVSLMRHHSFNVNSTITAGDTLEFAPSTSPAALLTDTLTVNSVPGFPIRDIGLPAVIAPGYWLGRIDGARLETELAAVLLSVLLLRVLQEVHAGGMATIIAWAGVSFSLPLLHYSSTFYPELWAALLTVHGLLRLQRGPTHGAVLLLGVTAASIPWFGARYWTIAASLAVLGVIQIARVRRYGLLWVIAAPLLASVMTGMLVGYYFYDLPLPNAGYVIVMRRMPDALSHNFSGLLGLWFDSSWGVLATAPVLALSLAGMNVLWIQHRELAIHIVVVALPYFIAISSTSFWPGGPTPSPRYLVPILPLFAVPLAAALARKRALLLPAIGLMCVGWLVGLAGLSSFDAEYTPHRLVERCVDVFGFSPSSLLPTIRQGSVNPTMMLQLSGWCVVIALCSIWIRRGSRV